MTAATVRLALNLSQSILSCCLAFCPSSAARPIAKVAADGSTRGAGAVECVDGVVASSGWPEARIFFLAYCPHRVPVQVVQTSSLGKGRKGKCVQLPF